MNNVKIADSTTLKCPMYCMSRVIFHFPICCLVCDVSLRLIFGGKSLIACGGSSSHHSRHHSSSPWQRRPAFVSGDCMCKVETLQFRGGMSTQVLKREEFVSRQEETMRSFEGCTTQNHRRVEVC